MISSEIYHRSPSLRRSIGRFAFWSISALACSAIALGALTESSVGLTALVWTLPIIAIYLLFVRYNCNLLRDPYGKQIESIQIANVVTAVRIFLVPSIVILLFAERVLWGMILYIIAAVGDIADGILARRLRQETVLGLMLDPVGDIVSTAAVIAFLWYRGIVPAWLLILLVVRYGQFFIGLAALARIDRLPKLGATYAGKAVGVIQAAGIVILLASLVFTKTGVLNAICRYIVVALGIAFCAVIVSQTVIGWRALNARRGGS